MEPDRIPVRTIRFTNGKSAAYAYAQKLRDAGALVSTVNVHAATNEVKVWTETPKSMKL